MEKCRTSNEELTARAWKLERDLETMTKMYEAEVRGRKTDTATLHSRPTSATDSAPVLAPASPTPTLVEHFTEHYLANRLTTRSSVIADRTAYDTVYWQTI